MSFEVCQTGSLQYLISTRIETPHCFSTRLGGVSASYLASLNLGIHRGDTMENCRKNYEILGSAVGFRPEDTVFARQVHSDIVLRVGRKDRGRGLDDSLQDVTRDGMVTNESGVALTVFAADCTPILLWDPKKRAIGAVHSGWRGTAAGIVLRAVLKMTEEFGSDPRDLRAAIGPCIGPCCFETHGDVPAAMRKALGGDADPAIWEARTPAKYHVDLRLLNQIWLQRAGVTEIDVSTDCTACQPDRFWSHRRVGDHRGSQAAIITLN